ncbi:MAG: dTDP-glucose 4,6-dehydratase [Bradymonadales bacterium]|nr:MAG: dTDP-glucose 4,6-dehydratase [Bradymonadales bacterium]
MATERKSILVTGGAGFIGANFIHHLFEQLNFKGKVINLDCLTYASNVENLKSIEEKYSGSRYFFEKVSINDAERALEICNRHAVDTIVHFAAESHVDRSILGPAAFVETNIVGTFQLLEVGRKLHKENSDFVFYHVSTDEVYGSLGPTGSFTEETPYDPRSPYSASKASSDHLVRASFHTYGLPVLISNCSNNYGPYQHLEKLIPHMITKMLSGQKLPVYGDGKNIRDWLYVGDHCEAIWTILTKGQVGETYNVGGDCEITNIDLVRRLCEKVAKFTETPAQKFLDLIEFVPDRPGHDRRYSIDFSKISSQLGWKPKHSFEEGIEKTLRWYLDQSNWSRTQSGEEYQRWVASNYGKRGG